jgi:outer membrane protein assembly factor BamB
MAVAAMAVVGAAEAETVSMPEPTWRVVIESEERALDSGLPVRSLYTRRFGSGQLLIVERPDVLPFPDNLVNSVGYIVLQQAGPLQFGQFGRADGAALGGDALPIAQGPDGRLVAAVRGVDGGVVGHIGGNWEWGYRFPALNGGRLETGHWVLASDASILAVDPTTRRSDWKVNIHEFMSGPMRWRIRQLVVSGDVYAHLVAEQPVGSIWSQHLLALDGATGQLRWSRQLAANPSTFLCMVHGDGRVRVYRPLRLDSGDRLEVQILDSSTGGELASASHPIAEDAPCSATGTLLRDFVTLPNGAQSETLALDPNGAIEWRVPGGGDALQRSLDALFVATPRMGTNQVIVDRRRTADGSVVWTRTLDNLRVDQQFMMFDQDRLRVVGWGNDALRIVDLDLETGAILPTEQPRFQGFSRVPAAVLPSGESVYTLGSTRSGGVRGLRVDRRSQATGEALSSNWIDLETPAWTTWTPSLHQSPSRLIARLHLFGTPTGSCAAHTALLIGLDPVGLQEVWRRRFALPTTSAFHFATLGDGRLATWFRALDPTTCASTPSLQLLSPVDGATLLDVPIDATALFATPERVVVYGPDGTGQPRFAAFSSSTSPDWVRSDVPASLQSLNPGVVADGFLYAEGPQSSLSRIRRIRGADGMLAWGRELGSSQDPIAGGLAAAVEPGQSLVLGAARQRGNGRVPLVLVVDAATGDPRYEFRPVGGPPLPLWWTLSPLQIDRGDEFWFASDRSDLQRTFSPRATDALISLRRLRSDSWVWSGDYILHRQQGEILPSRFALAPLGRTPDNGVVASHGVLLGRRAAARELLRFPAPSDLATDLRIRPLGEPMPLRGLGPSREVRVEIENAGAVAVAGARVRLIRPTTAPAIMTIQSCSALVGSASCPPEAIGAEESFNVSLEAGAVLSLTFEAFADTWSGIGNSFAETLLAVDTPYPIAEAEIADNQLAISLNLGGFANGFEP